MTEQFRHEPQWREPTLDEIYAAWDEIDREKRAQDLAAGVTVKCDIVQDPFEWFEQVLKRLPPGCKPPPAALASTWAAMRLTHTVDTTSASHSRARTPRQARAAAPAKSSKVTSRTSTSA